MPDRFRWVALGIATLAHALGSLAALAAAPLAPFIVDALQLSRLQAGLLLPAVYLGGVLMSLPAGWATEWMGVRLPLVLGLVTAALMIGCAALAPNLPVLLSFLVGAGLGFSLLNPTTGKAIYDWFRPRERGVAMGVKQAGLTVGGIASAMILPPIAVVLGWRWALAVGAAGALACSALVAVAYRAPVTADAPAVRERPSFAELVPFLDRPGVAVVFACGLALGIVQSAVLAYLVLYARETFALSSVAAARLLAAAHLGGMAARLGWGVISDRLFDGRRRPGLSINAALAALAFAGFSLGPGLSPFMALPLAVIAGAGAFGWVGLYFALIAEIGGARYAGLLTGLGVTFAWSGVLVGPPLFGVALDLADTYRIPWLLLSAIALGVALWLPRLQPLVARP